MPPDETSFRKLRRLRNNYIQAVVFLLPDERQKELAKLQVAFDLINQRPKDLDNWKHYQRRENH